MLGMLEMARLVSRRASTTSSMLMLVIKMDRSFTTTIQMALLCMAGWLQSFLQSLHAISGLDSVILERYIIQEDTTWQCTFAVTVAMLAPAVGVLQTMKFTWKLWDKLRNFLVGRMSTFISSAHGSCQWRTKKHSRGAQWNNEKALQQEWFLRIQEKLLFIWMGMYWLTLHILQDVLITAPSSSSSLVVALFNSKRVATFKDLMVPLCTLGSTLKWFVQLQVAPEAARLRGQTWWTWTIMFFAGCDKFKKFGQILQFF